MAELSRVGSTLCGVYWAMLWWGGKFEALLGAGCHCLQLMLLLLLLLVFSSLCLLSYLCFRFAHVFLMVRAVWRNMLLPLLSVCVFAFVCVCSCVLPVCGTVPYENLGHLMRFTCSSPLPLPLLSIYLPLCCSRLFDAPLKITHYLPQRTQVERRRRRQQMQLLSHNRTTQVQVKRHTVVGRRAWQREGNGDSNNNTKQVKRAREGGGW